MELHSTKQIKQPMVQRNFVVTLRPRLWLVSLPIKSIPARLRPQLMLVAISYSYHSPK